MKQERKRREAAERQQKKAQEEKVGGGQAGSSSSVTHLNERRMDNNGPHHLPATRECTRTLGHQVLCSSRAIIPA